MSRANIDKSKNSGNVANKPIIQEKEDKEPKRGAGKQAKNDSRYIHTLILFSIKSLFNVYI